MSFNLLQISFLKVFRIKNRILPNEESGNLKSMSWLKKTFLVPEIIVYDNNRWGEDSADSRLKISKLSVRQRTSIFTDWPKLEAGDSNK